MKRNLGIGLAVALVTVVALVAGAAMSAPQGKTEKRETVVLTKDNTLVLRDVIDDDSVGPLILKANELNKSNILGQKSKKPLYLFLDTPGGSIQSGIDMINALNGLGRPVKTITSFAASMGFQTVQNLGERLVLPNSTLMSHRARGEIGGEFGGISPSQMENRIQMWTSLITSLDLQTVKRTDGRQTLLSYQTAYANEMWRGGEEAVKEGYADKVVNVQCDESLSGTTPHQFDFMGIVHVTYELADCPLIAAPLNVQIKIDTNKGVKNYQEFIREGGELGPYCLQDKNKLCALDTTLTPDKLANAKQKFVEQYMDRRHNVVYMNFRDFAREAK